MRDQHLNPMPNPTPSMPPLPEPFIAVQDQPWGGHAEVIRCAIGEPGVISCYTAEQMHAFRAEGVREALELAAQIADLKATKVNSTWIAKDIADAIRSLAGKEGTT